MTTISDARDNRLDPSSATPKEHLLNALKALVPGAFSEGQLDLTVLKRAIGEGASVEEGERYRLDWAGKSDAYRVLQIPSTGTLRPIVEQSVGFENARHAFVEGENLETLKVLQKAYFGKVKLIYIDPPYNTGSDSFVYPDRFQESKEDYLRKINVLDDDGTLMREELFRKNSKETGHFHSNWLSMMLPRLFLARNLLADDGVMLVSIDDHEAPRLRMLMDEVFGEENFVAQFVWNNEGNVDQQSKIKGVHEYILCYARMADRIPRPSVIDPNIEETSKLFNDEIENSITKNGPANPPSVVTLPPGFPADFEKGTIAPRNDKWPHILDPIEVSDYKVIKEARLESGWSSRNLLELFIGNGLEPIFDSEGKETRFALRNTGAIYGYKKRSEAQGHVLSVIRNVGTTKQNSSMLSKWGLKFSYPKPVLLIRYLTEIFTGKDDGDIVLDFFAGSATTVQAVLELNALDGGNRKVVAVQFPEPTDEEGKTIADLALLRSKAAAQYIINNPHTFPHSSGTEAIRVFRLAPSNFKQWRGDEIETTDELAKQIELFASSEKDGANDLDMLFELLLKSGHPLCTEVKTIDIGGEEAYVAHESTTVFVLGSFTEKMVEPLLQLNPRQIIASDRAFKGQDMLRANLELQCRDADIHFTCV